MKQLRDENGNINWDAIYYIDNNTPNKDIIEILKDCCHALNREDELFVFVPAIEQAIKRISAKN